MRTIDKTFPDHVLTAAPAPRQCVCAADYLAYLLDQRLVLYAAALPYADHDDLAELVISRMWSRDSAVDVQALAHVADHPDCDVWIALAILLRVFPAPGADPALTALAARLVDTINAGRWPMRYSSTPVVTAQGLRLYESLTETRTALRLAPEIVDRARAHAAWIERGRRTDARFAMFAGAPIWAANQAGPETPQQTTPEK